MVRNKMSNINSKINHLYDVQNELEQLNDFNKRKEVLENKLVKNKLCDLRIRENLLNIKEKMLLEKEMKLFEKEKELFEKSKSNHNTNSDTKHSLLFD
jgi:hypothetical protein